MESVFAKATMHCRKPLAATACRSRRITGTPAIGSVCFGASSEVRGKSRAPVVAAKMTAVNSGEDDIDGNMKQRRPPPGTFRGRRKMTTFTPGKKY